MANISIGHQELQQAAADVRNRKGELQQFLDQASRAVEHVTGAAYRTRTASREFRSAHGEWNQATGELVDRLEEVARAIEETRQRDEQTDRDAAGRVGNIRGNGGSSRAAANAGAGAAGGAAAAAGAAAAHSRRAGGSGGTPPPTEPPSPPPPGSAQPDEPDPEPHPHADGLVPDGSEMERRLGYYDDFRWKPGSQPDEDLPPELSWLGPRDSSDRPPLAPDPHPDAEGRVPGPDEVADRLNPSDGAPGGRE